VEDELRIENELLLDFDDVLIRPKRSILKSRNEVDLETTYTFKHSKTIWSGIPIMAANMDGVGTLQVAEKLFKERMFTCLVKSYEQDELEETINKIGGNFVAVSTGTSDQDFTKLSQIINAYPEIHFICIDVANGYSEHFGDFVAKVRRKWPKHTIIAGNVVTADMTQELILRGADIVKVGIGPGAVCTTRLMTGVGYPQLSAIIECADAAHGLGGHIIADGGCKTSGDIAKAFGAGADFVMLGSMLAGHEEGGGEAIFKYYNTNELTFNNESFEIKRDFKKFVCFYGMSSETAMVKNHGEVANYRSSEGRTVLIPYKGEIRETVKDILGGLRSTCTYVGASRLKHLSKCTTFVRVNNTHNRVFENNTVGK
jgi:GMP reductase